jgi:glycosyltransferase involved in cell wall biosynthesis
LRKYFLDLDLKRWKRLKVLIIHPEFGDPGGVANFYLALRDKFTIRVKHLSVGKRVGEKALATLFRLFLDYIRFVKELRAEDYDIVHVNPSLNFKAIARDCFIIFVAKKVFGKKVVIYIHGWEKSFEQKLERRALALFRLAYNTADAFVVLSAGFRNKLREWHFRQPVYLETTVVDDDLLKGFDIREAFIMRQDGPRKLLFLSRIVKEKGIYETIDAFKLIRTKHPDVELIVAGDGEELSKVKQYVKEHDIAKVNFTGYVRGDFKKKLFEIASIFVFPTFFGEGMPVCVVEAMAFGLPVISRSEGGVADFFENGKHGFVSESKDPSVFANLTDSLLSNPDIWEKISFYNHEYAAGRFLASKVAARLTNIYTEVLQGRPFDFKRNHKGPGIP